MLSDYIDSCESIRKAVGNTGTAIVSAAVVCAKRGKNTTSATVIQSITLTSTMRKTIPVTKTNGYIIKRCKSAKFTLCTRNTCISLGATMCETTVVKCSFQEFCDKVTNSKCGVLEKIKKECKSECNNICVGSDEICKKFIKVTMEYCKKEANSLIIQLNEDLSPELINPIVLRFIGLQLYLRVMQEFSLLRDNFTKIIKNLSENFDAIKKCTCGNNITSCCSVDGKCLCTIFYKLFKATKILHDRYCKIIKYIKGDCDEDLYKVIPSLSLTRSIYLLTSYFNDYIKSDYMVEESECGCGKNVYVKPSLIGSVASIVFEVAWAFLDVVNKSKYTGLRTCTCHRYSSKLDDVVTLLLGGIEDTDDCDGLLSDVISMVSPLVEDKCVKDGKIKTQLTEDDTTKKNESLINEKLNRVNDKKKTELNKVITGINVNSNCDGNTAGSGVAGTTACASCNTANTQSDSQTTTTDCNGGTDINTACDKYTNDNAVSSTCSGSGNNICECNCPACKSGRAGECIMST